MQTGKKRTSSQSEGEKEKQPAAGSGKKFHNLYTAELALSSMKKQIAEQEAAVAKARDKLQEETLTRDTLKAVEVVLRFMKAHETGQTSILYAPGQESMYQSIVRDFLGGNPTSIGEIVRSSLVELTSQDRVDSFMSSLKILTNNTCYAGKEDERASCYLDESHKRKVTCKRENYIELERSGISCVGKKWVAYTNARINE